MCWTTQFGEHFVIESRKRRDWEVVWLQLNQNWKEQTVSCTLSVQKGNRNAYEKRVWSENEAANSIQTWWKHETLWKNMSSCACGILMPMFPKCEAVGSCQASWTVCGTDVVPKGREKANCVWSQEIGGRCEETSLWEVLFVLSCVRYEMMVSKSVFWQALREVVLLFIQDLLNCVLTVSTRRFKTCKIEINGWEIVNHLDLSKGPVFFAGAQWPIILMVLL